MLEVTQEQVDEYIKNNLQPLTDDIMAFARDKGAHSADFYLSCMAIVSHFLRRGIVDPSNVPSFIEPYDRIISELASERVRVILEDKG